MLEPTFYYQTNKITPKELNLIIDKIKDGQIGILPTDTIYGLVGSALNPFTVDKIYLLRKRTPTKPFIILISSINDLELFNIDLDADMKKFLKTHWPNPLSVILPCPESKFTYLHRGTKTLAFRCPKDPFLQKVLKKTGPLVAPSANFEGEKPAETIEEARNYFSTFIDFYIDAGRLQSLPSTLIELSTGLPQILRKGAYDPNLL